MDFIGVTTGKSSIRKVFPVWMRALGRPEVVLEGVDLRIHDTREAYRKAVAQIKFDPLSLGALVTTHKIDLYEAAHDLFDFADPHARLLGEVSGISKRDGSLEAHAKDPISSGLSLDALVGSGYFGRTQAQVLCFGAGGSAAATALHLIGKQDESDRPARFVVVNRSQHRLDRLQRMVESLETDIAFDYICNQDAGRNDAIMQTMPEGTVVINATGMGKDSPGSPITNAGRFPRRAIAWEFNYRGELDFLHQAEAQEGERELRVEDGWLYFLHGWTLVIAQVLHVSIDPPLFRRLAELAQSVR
jgi:shikimate 5-dehydrogenase